jgi:type IV secretion system protein VirB6
LSWSIFFLPVFQPLLVNKWLLHGIGSVFSLAVLSVMVTICMKMMAAITAAFAVKYLISMPELGLTSAQTTDGINSMALQQGGIGILLTTMILSAQRLLAARPCEAGDAGRWLWSAGV